MVFVGEVQGVTTIKFFAYLIQKTGMEETKLNLSGCSTVGDARELISSEFPEIALDLATCMLAVDMTFRQDDELLNEPREVAVIPPVSGG
ncbi:molybdopterin converting factor subunit 1 [Listeria ilorinensis]|uniref:molybdopterin converting factor subunit 1 n=1 Tax=Listeria ilorinensis TaxID=2867439 RepID=UPI001EF6D595|nr:molybdopterin converting factor subunit 1 [Listeria ilorinensis]